MTILSVTWANSTQASLNVIKDDATYYVPVDAGNYDYQGVQEWVAAGNTIAPYVPPVVSAVPASIALWQAKAALQMAGKLDAANSAVAAMNNPVLTSFWNDANFIDRASPTLGQIGVTLGMTSADIDNLFINADGLKL